LKWRDRLIAASHDPAARINKAYESIWLSRAPRVAVAASDINLILFCELIGYC
jgi:hypothetical protein